jgi:hypothetical protein
MRLFSTVTFAVVAIAFSISALAQESPEAAVRDYLAALPERGLSAAPDYMHPEELVRFKAMLLPIFQPDGAPNHRQLIAEIFGAEETSQSVSSMTPAAFMRGFLRVGDRQLAKIGMRLEPSEVVGSVPEGEIVHVIVRTRTRASELKTTQLEVVSVKKDGSSWKLMLSGRYEGMAEAFRAQSRRK